MFNTTSGRDDRDKVVITPPSSYLAKDYERVGYVNGHESGVGRYNEERAYEDEGKNYDEDFTNLPSSTGKPDHYNKGISPYDVAKTMYGAEGLLKFVTVNAIKYIQRFPHKYKGDPDKQLEDLIKAKKSLETAIELFTQIHGGSYIRHG